MWSYGFMGGWMILWAAVMVIFWGGLIALVIWGITRMVGGCGRGRGREHDALDVVKERYARGDISRDQFEQIKKDLA